ncbi:MAG: hypothetical protein J6Q64_03445, partial [Clostridia bacterium]|nr:hypothetical protein [Clostridia bacterium]
MQNDIIVASETIRLQLFFMQRREVRECGVLLEKHPCTPKTFNKGIFYGRIVPKSGQKRRLNTSVFEEINVVAKRTVAESVPPTCRTNDNNVGATSGRPP